MPSNLRRTARQVNAMLMNSQQCITTMNNALQLHSDDEVTQTCPYSGTSAGALYTLLRAQPASRTDAELRRRRWQLALYLLRDPFYQKLLWCCSYWPSLPFLHVIDPGA